MDDASATALFKSRTLRGKLLGALQQARSGRGEESITGAVMDAAELRSALAEMGDEVPSKDLFKLVQQADPDGDGVVTLPRFLSVVEQRRQQLKRQRETAMLTEAYIALGGDIEKEKSIKSALFVDVTSDFVGVKAAKAALAGVVKHKMKGVQAVLDAGGALDSDDEAEIKDTTSLDFDEIEAFASALREHGADAAVAAAAAAADDEDDEQQQGGSAEGETDGADGGENGKAAAGGETSGAAVASAPAAAAAPSPSAAKGDDAAKSPSAAADEAPVGAPSTAGTKAEPPAADPP